MRDDMRSASADSALTGLVEPVLCLVVAPAKDLWFITAICDFAAKVNASLELLWKHNYDIHLGIC